MVLQYSHIFFTDERTFIIAVDAVSVGVRSYDDEIRRRFPGSGGVVSANSAGL